MLALFLSEGEDQAHRKELGLRGAWGQSQATGSHLERDCGAEWRDGSELCSHDLQWQLENDVISPQGLPRSGG